MKPVFVGGSLSFKGDKNAKKKKSNKAKHSLKSPTEAVDSAAADGGGGGDVISDALVVSAPHEADLDSDLTDAERKALKKKRERELQELGKLAEKSHRERVEEFNERLASLTEHNDIPRVRRTARALAAACPATTLLVVFSHGPLVQLSLSLPPSRISPSLLFKNNQVSAAGNG
jgi:protein FAM32A